MLIIEQFEPWPERVAIGLHKSLEDDVWRRWLAAAPSTDRDHALSVERLVGRLSCTGGAPTHDPQDSRPITRTIWMVSGIASVGEPSPNDGGSRAVASLSMQSVWTKSVARSLDEALEVLATAVRDCPDALWQRSMWRVQPSEIVGEVRGAGGNPVTDPTRRDALVQRWSEPWSVAWHALEVLDYDLTGELDTWAPPPPFAGTPHWQTFASLPVAWSRAEIGRYIGYCQQRIHDTFAEMTEDKAATVLPPAHRYVGQPYAWLVTNLVGHTTAHATQIRQFVTTARDASPAQATLTSTATLITKDAN